MQYTLIAYEDFEKSTVAYTIVFDAVTGASESYTNQITSFTVEDGGIITDHAIKSKDKITIEGVVTDLSFNQGDQGLVMFLPDGSIQATNTESWSKKTKDALLDINEKLLPCSVKVSYKFNGEEHIDSDVFPCLIESLNLDKTGGQHGFIQPKIVLVPVRLARLEFTELTADESALKELKNQNAAASSAKTTTGSTGDGDGSSSSTDEKVPLELTKTAGPEQPKDNQSMIASVSSKAKNFADNSIKIAMANTEKDIAKVDAKIAQLESRR